MAHHADYASFSGQKAEVLESVVDLYRALADLRNWVANLANASLLLWYAYHSLGVNVNWAGFYVVDRSDRTKLVLGPFQGKVACQTIDFGRGVCGQAASTKETQLVKDVHLFPGHIACDGATKSEIVVPIVVQGATVATLDLDCLEQGGFDEEDQKWLEQLAELLATTNDW